MCRNTLWQRVASASLTLKRANRFAVTQLRIEIEKYADTGRSVNLRGTKGTQKPSLFTMRNANEP